MGKVWDWNIYGAKLNKFDGWIVHTAKEDGERGEDDSTAPLEDCGGGPEDGGSPENGNNGLENHDCGLDDIGMDSTDSDHELFGQPAVQVLAISVNFPVVIIHGYDWQSVRCIYVQRVGEVQELQEIEERMVDVVAIGPSRIFMACGYFGIEVYDENYKSGPIMTDGWDVQVDDEIAEYTQTLFADPSRKLEITYLVIPNAIEAAFEVKLNLKDLGSRSRAVYGKIKASATDYRNKSVHLFNCQAGTRLSLPSGVTSVLPLSPFRVAVPCRWQLELHIEVDLTVITACDGQEEQKNLKFSLEFTREITGQERVVDDDQVEMNVIWCQIL